MKKVYKNKFNLRLTFEQTGRKYAKCVVSKTRKYF